MPVVNTDPPGGIEIYFIDEGAGAQAILFCHGAGGNATSWWQQIPEFSGQYRTLAMDHRGYGRSMVGLTGRVPSITGIELSA